MMNEGIILFVSMFFFIYFISQLHLTPELWENSTPSEIQPVIYCEPLVGFAGNGLGPFEARVCLKVWRTV